MITNFIIIIYLASWTLFILLVILIGYMLDKSYKLASIYPQGQNKIVGETTFAVQPINSKFQSRNGTQQVTRYENNELDDFFNQMGDNTPQINYEEQLYNNGERNGTENNSPMRLSVDPKQVSSPRTNRSVKRSNTLKKTILRKPTIGQYEGIETMQTTNRKSLKVTNSGARLSQVNSERNSISDLTPRSSNNNKKQQQNQPKVSQFSIFGKNEQIKIDPNYRIPKPENDFYKCHQFSKIFYSHKEEMSRIFQILTIYFRQIICLDICGIFINFLPNLNEWINIGITGGIYLFFKILDYYMIRAIAHHQHSKLFKYIQYFLWLTAIGILIWLLIFQSLNNFMWLIEYLPSLLLDLVFVDPLKFALIKYCLQEPTKIREPKNKVDVLKVMQQIK